jgi:hypothetical protein
VKALCLYAGYVGANSELLRLTNNGVGPVARHRNVVPQTGFDCAANASAAASAYVGTSELTASLGEFRRVNPAPIGPRRSLREGPYLDDKPSDFLPVGLDVRRALIARALPQA